MFRVMMSDVYDLLSNYGYSPKQKGSWVFINCPWHMEDTPSLGIKDNFFKCYGCNKTGSIQYLLQELGIIEVPEIDEIQILQESLINSVVNKLTQLTGLPQDAQAFTHDYRGITKETYKKFDVFTSNFYPDEIMFPIYYEAELKGIIRKPLNGKYIVNFYEGYTPFNLANVFPTNLILVEGIFDALSVWQAGYKNVLAILGTANVFKIKNILTKINAKGVKILFDGDSAGIIAAKKMSEMYPGCKIIEMPEGTDPNSLGNLEAFLKRNL